MPHPHPPRPTPFALTRTAAATRTLLMAGLAFGALSATVPGTAVAQTAAGQPAEARRSFSIGSGTLSQALNAFASAAGVELTVDAHLLQGRRSGGLSGSYTVAEGFAELLRGQGLQAVRQPNGSYTVGTAAPGTAGTGESTLPTVTVKGTADRPDDLPRPYAGGQVARGGRSGLLGHRDVMDTPFNSTSYTGDLIRQQQAATIAEVLDNDPAVRTSSRGRNTSVGGGDNFFLRGFTLANRDISLDGLYGVVPYGTLSLEAVERVEVLKGPSALLNGMAPSGGVGGAINVVPKRATDQPITRLTVTQVSNAQWGGHVDVGRRWGDDNAFGVRANGVYRSGDTAIAGQSATLAAGALGLDYRGRRLRLSLDAGHQSDDVKAASVGYDFDATLTQVPAAPRAGAQFAQAWERRKFKDDYVAVRGEVDVAEAATLYAAAGTRYHRHTNFRARTSILDTEGTLGVMPEYYPESSRSKSFLVGGRVRFEALSARHELNIAASSLKADASLAYAWWDPVLSNLYRPAVVPYPSTATAADGGFFDTRKAYDRTVSSWGVADTVSWREGRVQLLLGLRRQAVSQNDHDIWSPGLPLVSSYRKTADSPAIGVLVKPWPHVSLYANHIEGLSPGATAPADAENAGEVFQPVKTKQKELGVKVDIGRLLGTLALFELRQPNAVSAPGSAPTRYRYVMDGEQRNRGAEFSVAGELLSGLRLLGGTTYLQARQVRTEGGVNDGKTAVAAPRWIGNLGLDWDAPFLPGLALSTRVLVTGSQYMNAANTLRLTGWTRWDLGARYQTQAFHRPVTLRANLLNVANRSYWESSGGSAGLMLGAPRTSTVSATIDF